ncbi:MAG: type IX secretion system membrane protein PorP/SprF [Bacteroidia bacterium]|nr:type IX secretion system membrane protein PorP/SprF [Bacteroidia bacterium]MDW8158095.1 type IX secretion system membrane protein PorP/SprF [Bacteroidia bacterium]
MKLIPKFFTLVFLFFSKGTFLFFLNPTLFAQQDPQFTTHSYVPNSYNPAAIGLNNGIQLSFSGRSQWVGIEGQPASALLTAHLPITKFMSALGLHLLTDRIGIFSANSLQINYAFSLPLGKKDRYLQLGISPMLLFRNMDATQFRSIYELPPNPLVSQILGRQLYANAWDASVGIFYFRQTKNLPLLGPRYALGAAINHVLQPTLSEWGNTFTLGRTFYLHAHYRYDISSQLISLLSSLQYKQNGAQKQLELHCEVAYRPLLWGIGYRGATNADALLAKIGFLLQNFLFIYSYDYTLSALVAATSGSHEITLCYFIPLQEKGIKVKKEKQVPDIDTKDFPQLSK